MVALSWNVLLGLVWVILTGTASGPNLVLGLIFGYLCLALIQNQIPVLDGYAQKVPRFIGFVFFFIWEVVKANAVVAYDVATPNLSIRPGVIAFPLECDTDLEITSLANFITLTPGTLSLDVSDDRSVLYIHAMYLDDEEALIEDIRGIERRLLRILR
jgi:multicomponent Na+:H+ antiporter subunit E